MSVVINGSAGVTTNSGAVYDSLQRDTAKASTSGTSVDFTGIPSWVRRITVMFNGVSTNGSSNYQIQIGSGSFTTSGYSSGCGFLGVSPGGNFITSGFFIVLSPASSSLISGIVSITNINGNNWVYSSNMYYGNSGTYVLLGAGNSPTLGGVLDRVRITTVGGTDTFDAGTINILFE